MFSQVLRLKNYIKGATPVVKGAVRHSQQRQTNSKHWLIKPFLVSAGVVVMLSACVLGALELRPVIDRPIARVKVTGTLRHIDPARVQRVIFPYLGQHFFELDLHTIRGALIALPWVSDVSLKRQWPDVLKVHLVEQQPLARWGQHGLLNASGKLFEPHEIQGVDALPMLDGPSGSEHTVMKQYRTLGRMLRDTGLNIDALTLTDRDTWKFRTGAITVVIGGGDVVGKLTRFIQVFHQVLASEWHRIKRVDLRYNNGIAVSWLDKSTVDKDGHG